jgi:hypothetical protein
MRVTWRKHHVYHLVDERNRASIRAEGLRSAASFVNDPLRS